MGKRGQKGQIAFGAARTPENQKQRAPNILERIYNCQILSELAQLKGRGTKGTKEANRAKPGESPLPELFPSPVSSACKKCPSSFVVALCCSACWALTASSIVGVQFSCGGQTETKESRRGQEESAVWTRNQEKKEEEKLTKKKPQIPVQTVGRWENTTLCCDAASLLCNLYPTASNTQCLPTRADIATCMAFMDSSFFCPACVRDSHVVFAVTGISIVMVPTTVIVCVGQFESPRVSCSPLCLVWTF